MPLFRVLSRFALVICLAVGGSSLWAGDFHIDGTTNIDVDFTDSITVETNWTASTFDIVGTLMPDQDDASTEKVLELTTTHQGTIVVLRDSEAQVLLIDSELRLSNDGSVVPIVIEGGTSCTVDFGDDGIEGTADDVHAFVVLLQGGDDTVADFDALNQSTGGAVNTNTAIEFETTDVATMLLLRASNTVTNSAGDATSTGEGHMTGNVVDTSLGGRNYVWLWGNADILTQGVGQGDLDPALKGNISLGAGTDFLRVYTEGDVDALLDGSAVPKIGALVDNFDLGAGEDTFEYVADTAGNVLTILGDMNMGADDDTVIFDIVASANLAWTSGAGYDDGDGIPELKLGAGTDTVTINANGATFDQGLLQIVGDGSDTIYVTNSTTYTVDAAADADFSAAINLDIANGSTVNVSSAGGKGIGSISGAGTFDSTVDITLGSGTGTFSGTASFDEDLIVSGGSHTYSGATTLGTAAGGDLVNINGGVLELSGTTTFNTAADAVHINNGGTLKGNTTGLAGAVTDGIELFNGGTLSASVGNLVLTDELNLDAAALNFTLDATDGAMTLGNPDGAGGNGLDLVGATNLTVTGTRGVTFSGDVLSNENLTMTAGSDGILRFAADQTSPSVTVNGGSLYLDADIANVTATTVNAGGTLNSSVGVATRSLSGTLDIVGGTLTFDVAQGSLAQDLLTVAGVVTTNGGTVVPDWGSSLIASGETFHLVTGASVTNTAPLTVEDTLIFGFSLRYVGGNQIWLDVARNEYSSIAETPNQIAVAGALDSVVQTATGDMAAILSQLDGIAGRQTFLEAIRQLSHEESFANTTASFSAAQQFGGVVQARSGARRTGAIFSKLSMDSPDYAMATNDFEVMASSPSESNPLLSRSEFQIYIKGVGGWGDHDNVDYNVGYDYSTYGFALGLDKLIGDRLIVGAAGGLTNTDVEFLDYGSESDIESWQAVLYGTWFTKNFHLDFNVGYGQNKYESMRTILFGNVFRTARSDHDADQVVASIGAGYAFRFNDQKTVLEPMVGLDYIRIEEDGYEERGAGAANLFVDGRESSSKRGILGLRVAHRFPTYWIGLDIVPEVRLAYLRNFADDRIRSSARFASGSDTFVLNAPENDPNSVSIGAGVNLLFDDSTSIFVHYDGELSNRATDHTAQVGFRLNF